MSDENLPDDDWDDDNHTDDNLPDDDWDVDDDHLTDAEADADALASCGWGTDEDYGFYGGDDDF